MQDASTTEAYKKSYKGGNTWHLAASIGMCGDVVKLGGGVSLPKVVYS